MMEIREFFAEGKNEDKSHVLLHITEPSNHRERQKGYFFAVAEIIGADLEQIEHLQKMIDDLESGYYETDEDNEEDKNSFELTLEYINKRGHHILKNKNSQIHCLVGIIKKNNLAFAFHGDPIVNLFFVDKQSAEIKSVDVLANEEKDTDSDQLFSSILEGEINVGDYFFVATPHTRDYFSTDRTKKIIQSRDTKHSAQHIEKVLKDLESEFSFGGLFIYHPRPGQEPKTGKVPLENLRGSDASITKMINAQDTTKELLSPSIFNKIKKKVKQKREEKNNNQSKKTQRGTIETNIRKTVDQKEKQSMFNIILIGLGKAIVLFIIGLYQFFKRLIIIIIKTLIALFLLISNRDKKRAIVIKDIKRGIETKKEAFLRFPTISKILLILSVLLTITFLVSISIYKIKENIEAEKAHYKNTVQAIIDKKNIADASLIYNNENKAMEVLTEAKNMLVELPRDNDEQQSTYDQLDNNIEQILQRLRKVEEVDSQIIIDKSNETELQLNNLTLINKDLLVYSSQDLLKYNLLDKNITNKFYQNVSNLRQSSTPKENDFVAIINNDNSVAQYMPESGLIDSKQISFPNDNVYLTNISVYSRKLYSLDKNNQQIYKHNLTQDGFDRGTVWLTDNSMLSNPISLAIDGDIFVAEKSGQIFKFTAGEKQEFTIKNLDPKLENIDRIWTYNGLNYIYILDSKEKRIVIIDKEGKTIKQLKDEKWQNPSDMVIIEEERTIYLLDTNFVYEVKY